MSYNDTPPNREPDGRVDGYMFWLGSDGEVFDDDENETTDLGFIPFSNDDEQFRLDLTDIAGYNDVR